MKLYDVAGSPNCKKVRVAARELGLPIDIVPIDLTRARPADYIAQNPSGKVPTLVDDDGFVLWESSAILLYLAEKKAGLVPADARARADMHRWLSFSGTHLQPWLSLLGQERIMAPIMGRPSDAGIIALAERELARFLPILNAQLEGQSYLIGTFSLADIAIGCGLENCEARGVTLPAPLFDWRERLRARPSWSDAR